jgi:RNA polymerase sigma-70 factor, ECF subfamily
VDARKKIARFIEHDRIGSEGSGSIQVPVSQELPARLGAELSREAIRLGRLLVELLPEPEVMGLIGLMLLQEPRRPSSPEGDLILLDQQDRSLWNRDQIAEGISFSENALASRRFGAYTLRVDSSSQLTAIKLKRL